MSATSSALTRHDRAGSGNDHDADSVRQVNKHGFQHDLVPTLSQIYNTYDIITDTTALRPENGGCSALIPSIPGGGQPLVSTVLVEVTTKVSLTLCIRQGRCRVTVTRISLAPAKTQVALTVSS